MNQIEKLMKNLGITREEAEQMMRDDEAIDKGAKLFEQTAEQKAAAKAACKGMARAVNAYGKEVKRERKPNDLKRWIIARVKVLCEGWELNGDALNVAVTNPERTIDFEIDGHSFTLTLTEHRKPKS
jgi:hypothetical protein